MSESVVAKTNKRPIGKKPFYVWATCDKDNKDVKFIINTNADLAKCLGISLPKGQIDILGLCRNHGYTVLAIVDDNDSILYKRKIVGVEILSEKKMPSKELDIPITSNKAESKANKELHENITNSQEIKTYKNTGNKKTNIIVALLGILILIGVLGTFFNFHGKNIHHPLNVTVVTPKTDQNNVSGKISIPHFPETKEEVNTALKENPVSSEPHDMTHGDVQKQDEELKKKMNIQTTEPIWDKKLFNNTQNWHP